VGGQVPDAFLIGMPLIVAILAGPGSRIKLIQDVVVHVIDEQMGIAPDVYSSWRRAILHVSFDDSIGRNGHLLHVALVGIGVNDDVNFGLQITVDRVVGYAVERVSAVGVLPKVRMQAAIAIFADDGIHDSG